MESIVTIVLLCAICLALALLLLVIKVVHGRKGQKPTVINVSGYIIHKKGKNLYIVNPSKYSLGDNVVLDNGVQGVIKEILITNANAFVIETKEKNSRDITVSRESIVGTALDDSFVDSLEKELAFAVSEASSLECHLSIESDKYDDPDLDKDSLVQDLLSLGCEIDDIRADIRDGTLDAPEKLSKRENEKIKKLREFLKTTK